MNNKLIKRAVAALAIKELIERVQEARAPRRSFIRRNLGKLALLGAAGAGFYVYQQQRAGQIQLPGSSTGSSGSFNREPSIEPDERRDSPIPSQTETTRTPQPTG